jgi:hypothetical protein
MMFLDIPFNPIFSLLQQEGYLTRSCLRTGLFALKKANLNNRGDFYVAFFQLSIGLERLMKIILLLDYMAINELRLPDNKWLRRYSHNLIELLNDVRTIMDRISASNLIGNVLQPQSLEYELLVFLDEFAQKARYANLDTLTGKQNTSDPLAKWNKLTIRIFESDVPQELIQRLNQQAIDMSQLMSPFSAVIASDLEKKPLSFETGWRQGGMFSLAAPYMIWRIMSIIYPIFEVLNDVNSLAQGANISLSPEDMIVPTMYEFFIDFVSNDKDFVLNVDEWLQNA